MYKPIENYGLIGNMHSAALVCLDGSIDWYCFPHFHSPAIFAAILDEQKGGFFKIDQAVGEARTQQFYLPESNVLVTRFLTPAGVAELVDFMPVVDETAPPIHWILRLVTITRGTMKLRVQCYPSFDFGRQQHHVQLNENGAAFITPEQQMELYATVPLHKEQNGVTSEFVLQERERALFVFRPSQSQDGCNQGPTLEQGDELFKETIEFWRQWMSSCTYHGRWLETVQRSALTLKLLTFAPTGAIIAAPTTSLPEVIGGPRNWDYRYTWLRDAAFTIYALIRIGFYHESIRFMQWLMERCTDADRNLQIMYTVDGRRNLTEMTLDHFEGYKRSRPVRIGNDAHRQLQLDIYGEVMDSAYLHNKYSSPISYDTWINLRNIANLVCESWAEPDCGIWEVRGDQQHFVYTKVMCWVALDRAIRLVRHRSFPAPLAKWLEARDAIYEEIMQKGWNSSRQTFMQAYDSDALDAANLIMPLVYFVAPNDPRFLKTLDAINTTVSEGGLSYGGLLFRYDNHRTKDGLLGQEGTFNMCSFWLVEALSRAGRTSKPRLDEARLLFERLLSHSNHLGLYSEELGPEGEALGNFPQAITHIALISAAYNLNRALDLHRGTH